MLAFASLEVAHACLDMVRTSPVPVAIQVFTRMIILRIFCRFYAGGAVEHFGFTLMVGAWCLSEVVRYAYYTESLLGFRDPILTWLRYSMFYVLYPIGALSESWLVMASIPSIRKVHGARYAQLCLGVLLLYSPGLVYMMTHMHEQRKRRYRIGHSLHDENTTDGTSITNGPEEKEMHTE